MVTPLPTVNPPADLAITDPLAGLREQDSFYQVFEQASVIIALLRGPGHFCYYCNPAFQALFPGQSLTGRYYAEGMPEIVAHDLTLQLDGVYATGCTFYGTELPLTTASPNGSPPRERYYDFSYHAYREKEQTVGITIFAHDVTGRVESRRATDRQRQLLHTLFMQAPVPIVILEGPQLIYKLVNPVYQQIFPGRVLLNKTLLEALPELTHTPIPTLLNQVYQTGETFVAQEMPLMLARHQGGPLEEIYWTFTYQARRNAQGEVDGILVFAYEVTEGVKARGVALESERQTQALAQELAAANEELQAANEEIQSTNEELADSNGQLLRTNGSLNRANLDLDNFIYVASHDLKAPINNIEGLMHLLLRSLPPESLVSERVQGIVAMIGQSVERFKKTIANLTDVVKLQKENDAESVMVAVAEVTREVLLDLNPLIVSSNARIVVNFADCPSVRFSPKNLRSVVYNLLSNAIKYCSPERTPLVGMSCRITADYHVLTVEDNGLGMEASGLSQLFTMFKRFHNHVEGSGIGLYMVKKMVENAGGHIEVESKLDQGTTFRVYFRR